MVTACNKLQLINISTASTPLYAVYIVTLSLVRLPKHKSSSMAAHMNCITFRRSLLRRGSWGSVLSGLSLWGCAKSISQVSSNACLWCCHSGAAHIIGSSTNHSKKKHEGLKCMYQQLLSVILAKNTNWEQNGQPATTPSNNTQQKQQWVKCCSGESSPTLISMHTWTFFWYCLVRLFRVNRGNRGCMFAAASSYG